MGLEIVEEIKNDEKTSENNSNLIRDHSNKKESDSDDDSESDGSSVYSDRNFRRENLTVTLTAQEPHTEEPQNEVEILDQVSATSESNVSNISSNSRKRRRNSDTKMCCVQSFGLSDIQDTTINYFEKVTLSNHPKIKEIDVPEIVLYRINSKNAQTAFKLRREEDLSVLTIKSKPYKEGCFQKITGSVISSRKMPCDFYATLIDLKTLEEVQEERSAFLHVFKTKEICLFLSKFELQVSNSNRIYNVMPLKRHTNRNQSLNEMIGERNLLFLSHLRRASPQINHIRKEPIKPTKKTEEMN